MSTLGGGSGGLERNDFKQFLIKGEGVMVLKELILPVSTLDWCGGL